MVIKCSKCGNETKQGPTGASTCCGVSVIAEMSSTVHGVGGMKR
jgi:hypothetical protein